MQNTSIILNDSFLRFQILRIENIISLHLIKNHKIENEFNNEINNFAEKLLKKIFSKDTNGTIDNLSIFCLNDESLRHANIFLTYKDFIKLKTFVNIIKYYLHQIINNIIDRNSMLRENLQDNSIFMDTVNKDKVTIVVDYFLQKYKDIKRINQVKYSVNHKITTITTDSFSYVYATLNQSKLLKNQDTEIISMHYTNLIGSKKSENTDKILNNLSLILDFFLNKNNIYTLWNEFFFTYYTNNEICDAELDDFKKITSFLFHNKMQKNIRIEYVIKILKSKNDKIYQYINEKFTIISNYYDSFNIKNIDSRKSSIALVLNHLINCACEIFDYKIKNFHRFKGIYYLNQNKNQIHNIVNMVIKFIFFSQNKYEKINNHSFSFNSYPEYKIFKNLILINDESNLNINQIMQLKQRTIGETFVIDQDSSEIIKSLNAKYSLKSEQYEDFLFEKFQFKDDVKYLPEHPVEIDKETIDIEISPSSIKKLLINPYFFYLDKILNFKIDSIESFEYSFEANIGTMCHKIIESISNDYADQIIQNEIIDKYIELELNKIYINSNINKAIYIKIFSLVSNFLDIHNQSVSIKNKVFTEAKISYKLNENITLIAIPDRYEASSNTVEIFDYKTGSSFSILDDLRGKNPQLFISSFILNKQNNSINNVHYISLKDRNKDKNFINSDISKRLSMNEIISTIETNLASIIDYFFLQNKDFFYIKNFDIQYENDKFFEHISRLKIII